MRALLSLGFRAGHSRQIPRSEETKARTIFWSMALIFLLHSAPAAHAFCVEPTFNTPRPEAPGPYRRPVVPSCLKTFKDTEKHTCESFEIAAYFDEVNTYIRQLNAYVLKSKNFAEDAANYSKEAIAYARCEAKEVKGQHK